MSDRPAGAVLILPAWVKAGALFGVLVLAAIAAVGLYSIVWVRDCTVNAVKPLYINAALKRIGDFPDNLLDDIINHRGDYHPIAGGRFPVMDGDFVIFDEKDKNLQFALTRTLPVESNPDGIEIIDRLYDMPVFVPTIDARFASIVDKGQEKISGADFHYETVLLKGAGNKNYKGLIGCLLARKKVVCVEAVVPEGKPLDVKYLLDFLRKAKGF